MIENQDDLNKKYEYDDTAAVEFFVRNGYLIIRDIFQSDEIEDAKKFIFGHFEKLLELSKKNIVPYDINGWCAPIMDKFALQPTYDEIITNSRLLYVLKIFLGPDIAIFNQDALWINVPKDNDPVLLKGIHTDAWTGTSVNTLFTKFFFTDVDRYNGMCVCPGSHLFGMVPVRNRGVDPDTKLDMVEINLQEISKGDVLIWHPLLLHSTAGHSDVNIRVSMTSRYTSTETEFSSQERSLGYRTLSVGPMNQILRLVGNDYLTPFRTLGGYVGVDRRLRKLYGYSDFKSEFDYDKYME